jgi:hypothetical protein
MIQMFMSPHPVREAILVKFVLVSGFHQHVVSNGTEKNINVMTAESINILLLNQHAVGGALPSGVNYYSTVATFREKGCLLKKILQKNFLQEIFLRMKKRV